MARAHQYAVEMRWTGNQGSGTSDYRAYSRAHEIHVEGKPALLGSSDPSFRGDPARYNPEELFVAALSSCHMLWYLHLAAVAGVIVTDYVDAATGTMEEDADGGGRFTRVVLHPAVTIAAGSDPARAASLHHEAHKKCFLANSVACPVDHEPTIRVEGAA